MQLDSWFLFANTQKHLGMALDWSKSGGDFGTTKINP